MTEAIAVIDKKLPAAINGVSLADLAKIGTPPPMTTLDPDEWGALVEEDRLLVLQAWLEDSGYTLQGAKIEFPRLKFPSGGNMWFTSPNDEPVKSFQGVAVFHHRGRSYYTTRDITGKPPVCSSVDGVYPLSGKGPTGATSCARCPYDVFGSAPKREGKEQSGKACRENISIFIWIPWQQDSPSWVPTDETPVLLRVPPTSIRPFTQYCSKELMSGPKKTPIQQTLTEFTLERNGENTVLKPINKGPLPIKYWMKARSIRERFQEAMQLRGIEETRVSDDIDATGTTTLYDSDGIPVRTDDEVPF